LLAQKHFTLEQLQYMNVELKHIQIIETMSCEELESYYFTVIDFIENALRQWFITCKMYIDIEINYIECCQGINNGKKTTINLQHFDVKYIEHTKKVDIISN
jgi:hypothetical protein